MLRFGGVKRENTRWAVVSVVDGTSGQPQSVIYDSYGCPNGSVTVKLKNRSFEGFEKQNAIVDWKNPNRKFRVALVVQEQEGGFVITSMPRSQVPEGADYFTVSLKHEPQYIMQAAGRWVIVVESGASRRLFRRRGIRTTYKLLDKMFAIMASSEPVPVIGTSTVGGIPKCLHVPTLKKGLHSVPT